MGEIGEEFLDDADVLEYVEVELTDEEIEELEREMERDVKKLELEEEIEIFVFEDEEEIEEFLDTVIEVEEFLEEFEEVEIVIIEDIEDIEIDIEDIFIEEKMSWTKRYMEMTPKEQRKLKIQVMKYWKRLNWKL